MQARGVLLLLGVVLVLLSLVVADRLARSMTAPITDLARTAERLGRGDLDGPGHARRTRRGPRGRRSPSTGSRPGSVSCSPTSGSRSPICPTGSVRRSPLCAWTPTRCPRGRTASGSSPTSTSSTRQVDALIREARRPEREGVERPLRRARGRRGAGRVLAAARRGPGAERHRRPRRPDRVPVRAARTDLEAALDALLGNVLSHTPDGTGVTVRLSAAPDGGAVLVVADEGPGFPDRVGAAPGTQRRRVDRARSRHRPAYRRGLRRQPRARSRRTGRRRAR